MWLAIWATGINTFFTGIWHQSACRKTPNGAPTWSSPAGEAVPFLCWVQPHGLESTGRSLPFHRLFNHTLKSGGQGVWKRPSNTFPGCEVKVLQWCGRGKAKKTRGNRKILGVRVKVDRKQLRSKDAEKRRGEKTVFLRERRSLFCRWRGKRRY